MSRKNRARPTNPKDLIDRRRAAFEAVGLQPEAAGLVTSKSLEIRYGDRDKQNGARRLDVFDALKDGMEVGAFDAARRLERDIRMRRGEHDHGRPEMKVDGAIQSAFNRNDQIIAAAERIERVGSAMGKRDLWLLTELIAPPQERNVVIRDSKGREVRRITGWRGIVAHITGETHVHAQAAVVRMACVNLRDAYAITDRKAA